jgi:hypothetical protein
MRIAEHGEIMDLCTTFPVESKYLAKNRIMRTYLSLNDA